jgi:hypothetical protein
VDGAQLVDRAQVVMHQPRPPVPLVGGHAVRLPDAAISAGELEPLLQRSDRHEPLAGSRRPHPRVLVI